LFYNLDSFQHEGSGWHEQRLFFHAVQPGKNRTNSAFWCGSPSVVRRSAIEAIGGVAEETLTEDLHTSIRLIRRGYRVVYIDRQLAVGLSPATIEDFFGQRFRWAQGAMQAFRKDNPLWGFGLTLNQRISFLASMVTWFDGLQKLVLFAVPIVVLLTGALPISTLEWPFWVRFIPYMTLVFVAVRLLSRGTYSFWRMERYNALKAFTFVSALATLLTGRARRFRVTSKEMGTNKRSPFQRAVIPQLVTAGLCFTAIAVGVAHLIHPLWYQQTPLALGVAIAWAVLTSGMLSAGVLRLGTVSRRSRYRFPIVTDINWRPVWGTRWYPGHSIDLSAKGIGFEYSNGSRLCIGDSVEVIIAIPNGELPIAEDSIHSVSESDIFLVGHIMGIYSAKADVTQRAGLAIDTFGSEADASRYAYLLHQPSHMLRGEKAFRLPRRQVEHVPVLLPDPLQRGEPLHTPLRK